MHQQIDTAVADTCLQISLKCVVVTDLKLATTDPIEQMGEHIAHHILALSLVTQHSPCQSEHPVVMTSEYRFKFSFVYHLSFVIEERILEPPFTYIQSDTSFS